MSMFSLFSNLGSTFGPDLQLAPVCFRWETFTCVRNHRRRPAVGFFVEDDYIYIHTTTQRPLHGWRGRTMQPK